MFEKEHTVLKKNLTKFENCFTYLARVKKNWHNIAVIKEKGCKRCQRVGLKELYMVGWRQSLHPKLEKHPLLVIMI